MPVQVEQLVAAANEAYDKGEVGRALALANEAVSVDGSSPLGHNMLGIIYSGEMQHDDAREAFAKATAIDPTNVGYHVNLAYSLILKGEFADAEKELNEALTLDPASGAAYQNLTWIKKAETGDAMIAKLEDLKKKGSPIREVQSQYCFALGKCYDDIGEYDLAFENFKQGNDVMGVVYDFRASDQYFAAIEKVWSKQFIDARTDVGFASDKPAFVVGIPRSGSSLLEHKLADHPQVAALGERPDVGRFSDAITRNHPTRALFPAWARELPPQAYAGFGKLYVEKFEAAYPEARRFIDKNLLNFPFIGFIRAMLPQATFIDCQRNPIDNCLSCYFQNLKPGHTYKFSLEALGHFYRHYDALMAHWRSCIGNIYTVQYETFVSDTEAETRKLLAALGLSEEAGGGGARHIQTSSAYQARQPIYQDSVQRWMKYEKHVGPLIEALGDLAR